MIINHIKNSSLEIVFKVQETCNINCSYCYMYNVGNSAFKMVPEKQATTDTWDKVAKFIIEENEVRDPSYTRIVIHGGEPMLIKPKLFESRMKGFWERLTIGLSPEQLKKIQFSLQTNGTLISDEWKKILIRWKISVGVSIDGPKIVHDERRMDKKGKGTYDRVMEGIRSLDSEPEIRRHGLGALCVIDHRANGAEVYRHIVDEVGFSGFNFLLPFMNWDNFDDEIVSGVSRFLVSAFHEWCIDIGNGKIRNVRIFFEAIQWLQRQGKPLIEDRLNIGHDVVVVECDGTIMAEESLRPTYIGFFSTLKVGECSVEDIRRAPQFSQVTRDSHTISEDCRGCALLNACRSGSSIGRVGMRYSSKDASLRKSVYCAAFIDLFVEVAAFLKVNRPDILNVDVPHLEAVG